jgi:hypothetical protein
LMGEGLASALAVPIFSLLMKSQAPPRRRKREETSVAAAAAGSGGRSDDDAATCRCKTPPHALPVLCLRSVWYVREREADKVRGCRVGVEGREEKGACRRRGVGPATHTRAEEMMEAMDGIRKVCI